MFTCVICGIPLIIYEKIAGTQMSRMVGIPFLVVTFVIIMRWGLREANCYFARLDERNLHFGLINRTTLPFSEIQAIVIGLPDKMTSAVNLNKYFNPSLWQGALAERRRSLLIVNCDHSIMQMNIHWNKNGTELMRMFVETNDGKVLVDYPYSDEQAELLKRPKWNRILRSFEIENAFRDVKVG